MVDTLPECQQEVDNKQTSTFLKSKEVFLEGKQDSFILAKNRKFFFKITAKIEVLGHYSSSPSH